MNVQWFAVGFFDLLGQREKLKDLVLRPGDRMDSEYGRRYAQLVAPVEQHRNLFEKAIAAARARWNGYQAPEQLDESLRGDLARLMSQQLQMHAFSDSVVLWTPLSVGTVEPQVAGLMELVTCAATVSLSLLAAKTTLRGGITVNVGSILPSGAFYGPVLGEAVHAESKVADWPRVILDEHACTFLSNARAMPLDNPLRLANRHVADECASLLFTCGDGLTCVDSFGPKFVGAPGDPLREAAPFKQGLDWLRAELIHFRESGNAKLEKKYRKLIEHIDARMAGRKEDDLSKRRGCLS